MLYFIGYKGISLVSKVIKWRTNGVYSHVGEIKNLETLSELSSFEGNGGVGFTDPSFHKRGTPYDIFELEVTKKQEREFRLFKEKQIGLEYDFLGILGFFVNRDFQSQDKWFCSELESYSCMKAGVDILNFDIKPPRIISPTDFLSSPKLNFIKSGIV